MGCIYKITNLINNKIYIGQTSQTAATRWSEHKKNFKQLRDDMAIHKAMFKYGEKNFSFEIIEECDNNLLADRECYWIAQYNSYEEGYNSTIGGEGAPKHDYNKFLEEWNNGATLEEIGIITGADRHTIAKGLETFGITSLETKTRAMGKRVQQYSLDGKFIAEFDSASAAARSFDTTPSNIIHCCNHSHASAYNYIWKYTCDKIDIKTLVENYKKTGKGSLKEVEQYSLDGEYIQTFSSCREAARSINAPYHVGINSCCLGRQKTAYGYKWKYKDA